MAKAGEDAWGALQFQTFLKAFLLPKFAVAVRGERLYSNLAALPTQRSESSELCVLGDLFKVRLPLPISGRV
ncbi:hypothetical protein CI807_14055 [Pseudomonas sp. NS1(2017)]|nr:hypothetical protein CI807_14055 [Pseudomonas sp. NS1(2017)]